ncbi:MAG: hypothetical protein IT204_20280 [Fimbriimonadaceae bacterium]|nr:hypothetical protein [Fimbriimonadaceae bacterium]
MRQIRTQLLPLERLTREPGQHFFGYYDVQPFSADGRYHLVHRVDFRDRLTAATDRAEIGLVRLSDLQYTAVSSTYAWCFQQGSMLQWHPVDQDTRILHNAFVNDSFRTLVVDITSGAQQVLSRPLATVDPLGRYGLSVNFARQYDFRPGYGYAGPRDPWIDVAQPADDGIWRVDLASGKSDLLYSLADLAALFDHPWLPGAKLLINHLTCNSDGSRFVALLRNFPQPGVTWQTATIFGDATGGRLWVGNDFGHASHYGWRDPEHLLIWADWRDAGRGLSVVNIETGEAELLDHDYFTADGHCSYSPDLTKVLYDSYPTAEGYRRLYLYDVESRQGVTLAELRTAPHASLACIDIRCDLHPRWNRQGTAISFDSVHEDHRHVYWCELGDLAGRWQR